MLVVMRFVVPAEEGEAFAEQARQALAVLAARPGYQRGQLARAYDDPGCWCLSTEWESVGAYRRALAGYDVKVTATPLLARAADEPSAYETLATAEPGAEPTVSESDRAPLAPGLTPVLGSIASRS